MKKKSAKKIPVVKKPENEIFPIKKTKVRVIGIGGGGSSIISGIAPKVKKASFVAANTDIKALRTAGRNVIRFQFGENFTHGLGTGLNRETGELAALAEKEKIKKLLNGQDLCVIVACLGGGTGSGAAHVFARIAKNLGCLTYGIFTLPFDFEGDKKSAIARESLEKIKSSLHAFSVIPNERIFQIIKKETPLKQALSSVNERLAKSLEGLIEIIYEPGLINIDFADLKTVLEGHGRLSYLNTVELARKEGAISEAIEKLLNSPLYPYTIRGAKGVLYNIGGQKGLTLTEVSQISKNISELVNKEAKIIFGISQGPKYGDTIKTTLLATGCGTKIFSNEKPIKIKRVKKRKKISPPDELKSKKTSQKNNSSKRRRKPKNKPSLKKIKIIPRPEGTEENKTESVIRKNALQLKKEAEKEEAEMLAREKFWETPAFLRKKGAV